MAEQKLYAAPRPSPLPRLLKPSEVAKVLAISERSVRRLAEQGALPGIRLGSRSLRFEPEAVAQFVSRGGVEGS
jgi:excisionase family DNA binding protein